METQEQKVESLPNNDSKPYTKTDNRLLVNLLEAGFFFMMPIIYFFAGFIIVIAWFASHGKINIVLSGVIYTLTLIIFSIYGMILGFPRFGRVLSELFKAKAKGMLHCIMIEPKRKAEHLYFNTVKYKAFEYLNGTYIVDLTCSIISDGMTLLVYIVGIPIPLMFKSTSSNSKDFMSAMSELQTWISEGGEGEIPDDTLNKLAMYSHNAETLTDWKKDNLFQHLAKAGDSEKGVMNMVIGLAVGVMIFSLIVIMLMVFMR